jgi:hypothetical protein
MKRVRIEKQTSRRKRAWLEILPLDPRDPDVVRAKGLPFSIAAGDGGPRRDDRARAARSGSTALPPPPDDLHAGVS